MLTLAAREYELLSFGPDGKEKKVLRRYRDFLELHHFLIDRNITKFIRSPFPEKSIFRKFEDRSISLQQYLEYVTEHFFCDELLWWLQN